MRENITEKKHTDTQVMEHSNPERILVIEDDGYFGRSLAELLHANEYFAHLTDSMADAREIILNDHFDIIICDADMPGATYSELIAYSEKYHPLVKVIIVSRKPEFPQALQAARDGAFGYIGKRRGLTAVLEKIKTAHHHQINHLVGNFSSQIQGWSYDRLNNSFPDYKVIRKIGAGAGGIVMLVKRERRYYALKLLHANKNKEEQIERLLTEADIMSNIKHSHVVKIFGTGFLPDGKIPYILMEYIAGGSLRDYIAEDLFSFNQKIKIIMQLCDALNVVHQCGILHRDIKPANIMMQKSVSVKLSDFGIARAIAPNENTTLEVAGSPAYMAPEAFLGGHVDPRSDLFSLGVVTYELLTGQKPFSSYSSTSIVREQRNKKMETAVKQFTNIPDEAQALLVKMLKFNPDDRFQTAAEIIPELKDIIRK